tara:strand:- start:82 stop:249 length:168 start_codon:yes stop_codon:yes gene_type:complete
LTKKDIKQHYLCGLAFYHCVFYSALDGANLGFKVFVFHDLAKTIDLNDPEKTGEK